MFKFNVSFSGNERHYVRSVQDFPKDYLFDDLSNFQPTAVQKNRYSGTDFYPKDGELLAMASMVYAEPLVINGDCCSLFDVQKKYLDRLPANAQKFMSLNPQQYQVISTDEDGKKKSQLYDRNNHPVSLLAEDMAWKCLLRIYHEESAHVAAIYRHKTKPFLVIAFKGTQTTDDWKENLSEIAYNNVTKDSQYSAAREWVINNFLPILRHPAIFKKYAVSLTGHSLGGWLANGILKDCEEAGFHFHLVTVDNPGAYPILKKLRNDTAADVGIINFDRTVYLSEPNWVNCCHQHVPVTRRLFPSLSQGYADKWHFHTLEAHSVETLLQEFGEDASPIKYADVLNWPKLTPPEHLSVQEKTSMFATFFGALRDYISNSAANLGFNAYRAYFEMVRQETKLDYDNENDDKARFILDTSTVENNAYLELSVRYKTRLPTEHTYELSVLDYAEYFLLKNLLRYHEVFSNFLSDWFLSKGYEDISLMLTGCRLDMSSSYEGISSPKLHAEQGKSIINFIKHVSAEYSRASMERSDVPASLIEDITTSLTAFLQNNFDSIAELVSFRRLTESAENEVKVNLVRLEAQLEEEKYWRDRHERTIEGLSQQVQTLREVESKMTSERGKIDEVILAVEHNVKKRSYKNMGLLAVLDNEDDRELRELNAVKEQPLQQEEQQKKAAEDFDKLLKSNRNFGTIDLSRTRTTDVQEFDGIHSDLPVAQRLAKQEALQAARERKRQEQQQLNSSSALYGRKNEEDQKNSSNLSKNR